MNIKENLQWVAIALIVITGGLLVFGIEAGWHIGALVLLAVVGAIEWYLIANKLATITRFYIPILPKKIDWPIAIASPIVLIMKAILMWHNKEIITIWWVSAAIIETWIASHLCSFERKQQND